MSRKTVLFIAGAVVSVCATAERASAQPRLILDESAYCRSYVQFGIERLSPAGLTVDGEKVLGNVLDQLKRKAQWQFEHKSKAAGQKYDPAKWADDLCYSFQWLQYGGDRDQADLFIDSPAPPPNWSGADFDDSSWLYQRKPLMVGREFSLGWYRRAGYFRFHFNVPDPAAASKLHLRMMYHGGVRALLNGGEVARGHLPSGELAADSAGDDYPLEAYILLNEDGTPAGAKEGKHAGMTMAGEIFGRFEDAPPALDAKGKPDPNLRLVARRNVNRANWDRIGRLRDRVFDLDLPADKLRKGDNVLAVEIHVSRVHPVSLTAGNNWTTPYYGDVSWSHGQLAELSLAASGSAPSMLDRPAGLTVWPADMHRQVISSEFLQSAAPIRPMRMIGALGGCFSGQLVISTDKTLAKVTVTPSALAGPEGATIPTSAMSAFTMIGHPLDEWKNLGEGRGGMPWCKDPLIMPASLALYRHGPAGIAAAAREQKLAEMKKLLFYDEIGPAGAAEVAANTSRPFWISLNIPTDAKPGKYAGSLLVLADGQTLSVPVEVQVANWRIPAPADFEANAALEQSPYGVAIQYKVPLWSDEHFRLMEASFKQLALVGNDWLNIPVISFTEFGNVKDSMVPWRRTDDGNFAFDYAILDRYLDMAVKHLGKPRVINFIVMHGTNEDQADVEVKGPAGQTVTMKLGNREPEYEKAWRAFAGQLHAHMRARGLEKSMYWGFFWDSVADPELVGLLASVCPDVRWTSGAHRGKEHYFVTAYSQLLPFHLSEISQQGWRRSDFHVLLPRGGGSLIAGPGVAFPFNFRLMVDRSLVVGMNGVGRIGADYWGDSYIKGLRAEGFLRAGMPHHYILWPGPEGARPSVRFMALREGFQEAEARIYLEQLLSRKALPEALAAKVAAVLYEHHRSTLFVPSMDSGWQYVEQARDWQDRSERLFAAAAEAAAVVGLDLDRYELSATLPARGKSELTVKIRCWAGKDRAWKVQADQPWIVPAQASGNASGHQNLVINLDATKLPPGEKAAGKLTVTDVAGGTEYQVTVTAQVSKVLASVLSTASLNRKDVAFIPDDGREVLNAAPGQEGSCTVSFFNKSAGPVAWKAAASLPWVKVEPASGKAEPETMVLLKLTARPPADQVGRFEAALTIIEDAGDAKEEIPLAVYSLPARNDAVPAGTVVLLTEALHKELLKSRKEWHAPWCGHEIIGFAGSAEASAAKDGKEKGVPVQNIFTAPCPQETVYKIEGKGYKAFSARVDLPAIPGYKYWDASQAFPPDWVRVRFEIHVDGKLSGWSGWIGNKEPPQTLTATGLENAKELKLVTRFEKFPPHPVTGAWWDARFVK